MADSILRLRVDSAEYNNKLKQASEQLTRYADGCRKAGGTLEHLDDGVQEFVRELGKMDTSSKTVKGSLSELTRAFTDLTSQYNKLTDEEKNAPFGKELKSSLDQLKSRIQDSKRELDGINREINGGGGLSSSLDDLAGKFGINIKQLVGWGTALAAAKGAMDVLKDAFFTSESNVDDWGRTVAATESVYQSFLISLNNSSFSGFLSNIQNVIDKAKEAYNAMDQLNTSMTIINPERTKLQAEATRLKAIIRREGKDSEAGKEAQALLRALEPRLQKSFVTESKLNKKAFTAEVDRMLASAGINMSKYSPMYQMLMQSFSNHDVYEAFKNRASGSITSRAVSANGWGSYRETTDTRNMEKKLLDLFTDEWRQKYSPYLNASYSAIGSSYSTLLGDARYLKKGGGGGGKGGKSAVVNQGVIMNLGEIGALGNTSLLTQGAGIVLPVTLDIQSPEEKLRDEIKRLQDLLKNAFTDAEREAIGEALEDRKGQLEDMLGGRGKKKGKSAADDIDKFNGDFSKVVGGVGNIVSGIQSMGIEIPEGIQSVLGVLTGISSIMSGITAILTLIQIDTKATAIASATDAIIPLARGGVVRAASGFMVPGNNYSGDLVPAYLNSGEMVLNKFQQQALAGTLENGGMKNISISGALRGEDIVLVADRYGRRTGKGELAFWR